MTKPLRTPWGAAQTTHTLAPSVTLVTTASHGGLLLAGDASMPPDVGETFINGPDWAEEDCELPIALAILHRDGVLGDDALLGQTPAQTREMARTIARRFPRYAAALGHLDP